MTASVRATVAVVLSFHALPAQDQVIPAELAGLPGNSAISMPVRWSQGIMQVIWDEAMIPEGLKGQAISSIRMRRPAFAGEPDYAAQTRTVRLSMGMTTVPASQMAAELATNRPETLTVVAGPGPLSVPATVAHGPGDAAAATLVTVFLDQPFTVESTGNLFLEWENLDSSLSVDNGNWVEAVQAPDSGGLALELGNGGCGSLGSPTLLRWVPGPGPATGELTSLVLQGAPPGAPCLVVLGLDPENRQPPLNLGFGADLARISAPGCHQWTGVGLALPVATNASGNLRIDLPFPADFDLAGKRVGVQVLMLDPSANPAGVAVSHGIILLIDTQEFATHCSTVLMPGVGDRSPFLPLRGVAPVVHFGF